MRGGLGFSVKVFFCALAAMSLVQPVASAAPVLIDFGRHDGGNGAPTPSPDANGRYWNSVSSVSGTSAIPLNSSFSGFVDQSNTPTGMGITVTSGVATAGTVGNWEANGYLNGGLLAPQQNALKGNVTGNFYNQFAQQTVTGDYWFTTNRATPQTFNLTGLNPSLTYDFAIFATRDTTTTGTGNRATRYTLTGQNSASADLQTSGPGSGSAAVPNGNDDTVVELFGLRPNLDGTLQTKIEVVGTENFAYLGVMQITAVPEPTSLGLLGVLGAALAARRRR